MLGLHEIHPTSLAGRRFGLYTAVEWTGPGVSEWGFKEEMLEVLDNDESPRELRLQCTNWEGREGTQIRMRPNQQLMVLKSEVKAVLQKRGKRK